MEEYTKLDEILDPFKTNFVDHKEIIDQIHLEENVGKVKVNAIILALHRMAHIIEKEGIQSYFQVIDKDPIGSKEHAGILFMLYKDDDPFYSIEDFEYHFTQKPDIHEIYRADDNKCFMSTQLVHEDYCIDDRISIISILVNFTCLFIPLIRNEMNFEKWCEYYGHSPNAPKSKVNFTFIKNRFFEFSKFVGHKTIVEIMGIYDDIEQYAGVDKKTFKKIG